MPTLNWIGKDAVVKHHKDVPYRLLEPVPELSCGDPASGNLIVQGDNLHALKALLPRYAGQVKCIYIDPPYNTGNEGWAYNDNVNSPEIRKWLGEVVGKEGETLDRHDRWLCMMYPRLVLLRQFLREDGAIFVSIDDNEVAQLRLLMDEIFGAGNFVANLVWQKKYAVKSDSGYFSESHDHIVTYARSKSRLAMNGLMRTEEHDSRYGNPDNDPRGAWTSGPLQRNEVRAYAVYAIVAPNGREHMPPQGTSWRFTKEKMTELVADDRISFGTSGNNVPRLKRFLSEVADSITPTTWWDYHQAGHNDEARRENKDIFAERQILFATPKPTRLLRRIFELATDRDSLVLDSFAGSASTGHAVLKQNAVDGGKRRFILVEMDPGIAHNVTAERVRRVAEGYTNSKGQTVAGLGGGFQFCTLSKEPLFTPEGQIRPDVTFAQLAEFVWFIETGSGKVPEGTQRAGVGGTAKFDSPLLGVFEGRAIYLLYNGILKDRSVAGGNVLTGPVYELLPRHDGSKVIYAAASRLGGPRLARENIVFKQTPYALEV